MALELSMVKIPVSIYKLDSQYHNTNKSSIKGESIREIAGDSYSVVPS
jgi:hypothetical protein